MKEETELEKSLCKDARSLIDKKDYDGALRVCAKILNKNPENYKAIVFSAVSFEKKEKIVKAEKAYKKAIQIDPNKQLAYQGLIAFYDKKRGVIYGQDEIHSNFLEVAHLHYALAKLYGKDGDFSKCLNELQKTIDIFSQLRLKKDVLDIMKYQINYVESQEEIALSKLMDLSYNVISFIFNNLKVFPNEIEYLMSLLKKRINSDSSSMENFEMIKIYLKLLDKNNTQEISRVALIGVKLFPNNRVPYESLCQLFILSVVWSHKKGQGIPEDISKYYNELLLLNSDSAIGITAKGADAMIQNDYSSAIRLLSTINGLFGLILYCRCLHKTCEFSSLEPALDRLQWIKDLTPEIQHEIDAIRLDYLYKTYKIKEASQLVQKMKEIDTDDFREIKDKLAAFRGEYVPNPSVSRIASGIQAYTTGDVERFVDILSPISEDYFEASYILGFHYYNAQCYEKAHVYFLKSAKSNPFHPLPFKYLGLYYIQMHSYDKARKCLQKSFKLDPTDGETGTILSKVYEIQGDCDAHLKFLTSAGTKECNRWAHTQLGIYYLNMNQPEKAIPKLQSALRFNEDIGDISTAEALGDAYMGRGSYSSAMKIFREIVSKVEEDSSLAFYSTYHIAKIKLILGEFESAITDFQNILAKNPTDILSLKGLSESYLNRSRHYIEQVIDINATEDLSEALKFAVRAAELRPELSCIWKLCGDCCLALQFIQDDVIKKYFTIPACLEYDTNADYKFEIFRLGKRFASCGLKYQPDEPGFWHDFGLLHHLGTESSKDDLVSVNALKRAVSMNPSSYMLWNTLGLIAFHKSDFALAQHSFIKSVQLGAYYPAWTNLGILYLSVRNYNLANRAFREAQNLNPSFVNSWSGQALVAENICPEEAMDLFRHSAITGNECLASAAFGEWVCRTIQEVYDGESKEGLKYRKYCIEKLYSIPMGVCALDKFLRRYPKISPVAWNHFGILTEYEGLFKTAKSAYETGHSLSASDDKLQKSIKLNLSRVCYKMGEYEVSIEILKENSNESSYLTLMHLALCYYSQKKFKEAYSTYQLALNKAPEDSSKSDALTAMGCIAYCLHETESSKVLLLQAARLPNSSSLRPFFALCVLGIKTRNGSLIQAALKEIESHKQTQESIALKAMIMTSLQNKKKDAMKIVAKAAHEFPDSKSLWKILTIVALEDDSFKSSTIYRYSQKADDVSFPLEAFTGLHCLNDTQVIRLVSKAIHKNPMCLISWTILLRAVGSQHKNMKYLVGHKVRLIADLNKNILNHQKIINWIEDYVEK